MQFTIDMDTMRDVIMEMYTGPYKGKKIELIKVVRNLTGLGLKDTKDLVEDCQAEYHRIMSEQD
jgi:ribosomal protein L7/L12